MKFDGPFRKLIEDRGKLLEAFFGLKDEEFEVTHPEDKNVKGKKRTILVKKPVVYCRHGHLFILYFQIVL